MAEVYRFDRFEVDADNFALLKSGEPVTLEPLVIDLIIDLLRHPGKLRTRDDLIASVWNGRIVSDSTISTTVKKARKVLDDSGDEQRCIKTVRGRGFLFATALESRPSEPQPERWDMPRPALSVAISPLDEVWTPVQIRAFGTRLRSVLGRVPVLRISAATPENPEDLVTLAASGISLLADITVREDGDKTAMDVALIDTNSGLQCWARSFSVDTLPGAPEILLHNVVAYLEPALMRAMIDSFSGTKIDPHAHVLEAIGTLAARGWNRDSFARATTLLDTALRQDSEIALAHAYLALIYALSHRVGIDRDPARLDLAIHHAETALELETQDSFVLGITGCALCDANQLQRGLPILHRAAELDPQNGHALTAIGAASIMEKRFEDAVASLRDGIKISPADSRLAVWEALLAMAELVCGRVDHALEAARSAVSRDDKNYLSRLALAAVLAAQQEDQKLAGACDDLLRVHPKLTRDEVTFFVGRDLSKPIWQTVLQARQRP
ncbi:MAG: winged helix-turn-helix domain-containing protein [Pseudomonadota bacterium]